MAALSYVFTIARVPKMLGEDEALLENIASDMDPEDGCLSVLDLEDAVSTTAFTPFGVEALKELLADLKPDKTLRGSDPIASDHRRSAGRMVTDHRWGDRR